VSRHPVWRKLFRLGSPERDVDEEIAFHLAMREAALRRLGEPPERAHTLAAERFGDAERVRSECVAIDRASARERRVTEWLASVASDVRVALRAMRRAPGFTAVAVATLALGIGATSAMFSLVDGILLRPLPYAEPERLVVVRQAYPEIGLDSWSLTPENVAMYRDRVHALQAFAGYARAGATFARESGPQRLSIVRVTGDFFAVLGVPPVIGRTFGRAEDTPQPAHVAVLSYGLWQSEFGGRTSVLETSIDLDGQPTRVIGVMPRGFNFPRSDDQAYVPLGLDPTRRYGWYITGLGRLAPGGTLAELRRDSRAVMWDWAGTMPGMLQAGVTARTTRMTTVVTPLRDALVGDSRRPLLVLQAAVLIILLIAVANIATLLASRAGRRSREVSLRNALGASGRRVVRQLLTESVALGVLGGCVGVLLALVLVRLITSSPAVSLPRLAEVGVSWRVVTFTLVMSVTAGIGFGMAPATALLRGRAAVHLAGAGRGSVRAAARRLNRGLIAAQLALAVMLLISAGLVLQSFRKLTGVPLGFEPGGVTVIGLPLPARKYANDRLVVRVTSEIVDRVRTLPGVRDAAIAWTLPYSSNFNSDGYLIEGHAPPAKTGVETQTVQVAVGPGYFRTLRIPLGYGRDFDTGDRAGSLPVAIVDEALASRYWHGADALGHRLRLTGDTTWFTIVGVAGSVRDEDAARLPQPHTYFPFAQAPDFRPVLAVRTTGDAAPAIAGVRRAVATLEPHVPLDNVRTLDDWVGRSLDVRRITELLLAGFAVLAALLASVGIYGVMSLYVADRYHEFGIRLALGAQPATLVRLVLGEGVGLALLGVGVGTAGAAIATRWLGALLYEVKAFDPVLYATLGMALLAIAAASVYLPARRATRSDPLVALRAD
jgi:putative ABC transport system permease protein